MPDTVEEFIFELGIRRLKKSPAATLEEVSPRFYRIYPNEASMHIAEIGFVDGGLELSFVCGLEAQALFSVHQLLATYFDLSSFKLLESFYVDSRKGTVYGDAAHAIYYTYLRNLLLKDVVSQADSIENLREAIRLNESEGPVGFDQLFPKENIIEAYTVYHRAIKPPTKKSH